MDATLETPTPKLLYKREGSASYTVPGSYSSESVWGTNDLMEIVDHKKYREILDACRFFYRHDPIVSTVFNKMIEIGINDLRINETDLAVNTLRIIEGLKDELKEFAEKMALEFLISGLVIPEINFRTADKAELENMGVKRYSELILPIDMWLRDPRTVRVETNFITGQPIYYVEIPSKLIEFITTEGGFGTGIVDKELYREFLRNYPEFVKAVKDGIQSLKLDNPLIFRRKPTSDTAYPNAYLYPVIESLKHKRNLKRMDYSIAARAIAAIQLIKMGSDDFPITEDQEYKLSDFEDMLQSRNNLRADAVERIFALVTNHTVDISWVYPPLEALLDDTKYKAVNSDIMLGLGFPRILITGETERTGTSDAEFATLAPIATMENIRGKVEKVLNSIVEDIMELNNLRGSTEVTFEPINLRNFDNFINSLTKLYETGNLSRKSFASAFGYNLEEEFKRRSEEDDLMEKYGLEEYNPQPFSNPAPNTEGNPQDNNENQDQNNDNPDTE